METPSILCLLLALGTIITLVVHYNRKNRALEALNESEKRRQVAQSKWLNNNLSTVVTPQQLVSHLLKVINEIAEFTTEDERREILPCMLNAIGQLIVGSMNQGWAPEMRYRAAWDTNVQISFDYAVEQQVLVIVIETRDSNLLIAHLRVKWPWPSTEDERAILREEIRAATPSKPDRSH